MTDLTWRDDDNKYPCCRHCHEPWSIKLTVWHHDQPCEACRQEDRP